MSFHVMILAPLYMIPKTKSLFKSRIEYWIGTQSPSLSLKCVILSVNVLILQEIHAQIAITFVCATWSTSPTDLSRSIV